MPGEQVQQLRTGAVVVATFTVAKLVGALVVGVADTSTQAHLSAGSGRPKSYQCLYPGLHVQQLRAGVAVLSAALVEARVGALVVVVGALVVGALVVVVVGALVVVVVGEEAGMDELATTPATGMYPFSMFTMLTPR
jgi:hypothetical protein